MEEHFSDSPPSFNSDIVHIEVDKDEQTIVGAAYISAEVASIADEEIICLDPKKEILHTNKEACVTFEANKGTIVYYSKTF